MVVLDQFYQIEAADTSRITIFWKVAHITTFFAAAACGFITAFTFGSVLSDFGFYCVLNANISFTNETSLKVSTQKGIRTVRAIDTTLTFWGSSSDCNFAQFTPLFITISALIWAIYFIIIARGGRGHITDLLARPYDIVYPCILFSLVSLIVYLVSTFKLWHGLQAFCKQFDPELGNHEECVEQINVYTKQFIDKEDKARFTYLNFYLNQAIAVYSSQVGIWMWVIQLLLLISRVCCVTDFDLHLVTILPKEEEVVEMVVEPDEEDELQHTSKV